MSIIGGKSIVNNASIIGTNYQHNQQNLYNTHTSHRIVNFSECVVITLSYKCNRKEFKVLIHALAMYC